MVQKMIIHGTTSIYRFRYRLLTRRESVAGNFGDTELIFFEKKRSKDKLTMSFRKRKYPIKTYSKYFTPFIVFFIIIEFGLHIGLISIVQRLIKLMN